MRCHVRNKERLIKVPSNDIRYWVNAGRYIFFGGGSWLRCSRWLCLNDRPKLLYLAHERFYDVLLQPWRLFQCNGALAAFIENSALQVWNKAFAVDCTEQNPSETCSTQLFRYWIHAQWPATNSYCNLRDSVWRDTAHLLKAHFNIILPFAALYSKIRLLIFQKKYCTK